MSVNENDTPMLRDLRVHQIHIDSVPAPTTPYRFLVWCWADGMRRTIPCRHAADIHEAIQYLIGTYRRPASEFTPCDLN